LTIAYFSNGWFNHHLGPHKNPYPTEFKGVSYFIQGTFFMPRILGNSRVPSCVMMKMDVRGMKKTSPLRLGEKTLKNKHV